MRRHALGFVAAMEEEARLNTEEAVQTEDTSDNLENELLEVADSSTEEETRAANTDEAADTAEALEGMYIDLKAALENGGLDRHGAAQVSRSLALVDRRMGTSGQKISMESFGAVSGRAQGTKIAMEEVMDKLKDIWKAILAQLAKVKKWIVDHYNRVFGAAEKLAKRAKAIQEKAKNPGTVKEKTFEDEKIADGLAIEGSVDGKKAAAALKAGVTPWFENWQTTVGTEAEAWTQLLDRCAEADGLSDADFSKVATRNVQGFAAAQDGSVTAAEGVEVTRGSELPGGKAVYLRIPSKVDHAGSAGAVIGAFKKDTKAPSNKSVKTLEGGEIETICSAVIEVAELLRQFRNNSDKSKKLLDKAESTAKKIEGRAGGDEDEAKRKAFSDAAKLARAIPAIVNQPTVQLSEFSLRTAQLLLTYCEKSLKNYESK